MVGFETMPEFIPFASNEHGYSHSGQEDNVSIPESTVSQTTVAENETCRIDTKVSDDCDGQKTIRFDDRDNGHSKIVQVKMEGFEPFTMKVGDSRELKTNHVKGVATWDTNHDGKFGDDDAKQNIEDNGKEHRGDVHCKTTTSVPQSTTTEKPGTTTTETPTTQTVTTTTQPAVVTTLEATTTTTAVVTEIGTPTSIVREQLPPTGAEHVPVKVGFGVLVATLGASLVKFSHRASTNR